MQIILFTYIHKHLRGVAGDAPCDVGPGGGGETAVAGTVPVDIRVGRGT